MDRFKAFVREKGLYLLCLAVAFAATAAGILALRRIVGHLTGQPGTAPGVVEQPDTLWEQPDTAVEKPVADIPKPTQTPAPTPTPSRCDGTSHTIVKGDTLYMIAKRYGVPLDALIAANDIKNPDLIQPGQKIILVR